MSAAPRPWEYFVEDEMTSGDLILEHKPVRLLKLIADLCEQTEPSHNGALYELLEQFFTLDTPAMKAMRDQLWREDYQAFFQLAQDAQEAAREHRTQMRRREPEAVRRAAEALKAA